MANQLYFQNASNQAVKIYRHEIFTGSKTTYVRTM